LLIDANLPPVALGAIPEIARAAEVLGFDAVWTSETVHDPFLPGALIAEHTRRLSFGTAIAVAFARSPATLAYTAWDLAVASGGRFILGLGTQVKAHIERRFGMPWPVSPVGQLREQMRALRAFWQAWQSGEPLNFRGQYYKLTLMSPFFNPGPIDNPDIPIYIAGVNTGLARLAGECADGFHAHPFHSAGYLRQVILPAVEAGCRVAGRTRKAVKVNVTAFTADTQEEREFARQQLAFYASTPSYRGVMAFHGWEAAAERLSGLAARGKWAEMPSIISDEMLETFAVLAPSGQLPGRLLERYQGIADRLGLYLPFVPGQRDDWWRSLLAGLRQPANA
jgi:probable F420-dependent oxidoreductase